MTEEWATIKGYEGYYAVSTCGRVMSLARVVPRGQEFMRVRSRTLRPGKTAQGYSLVVLRKDKRSDSRLVHRLVAEAFLPQPSDLHEVDHINGVRDDNRLANLRWATRSQNNGNLRVGSGASQYRGVVKGQNGRWAAQIGKMGKHVFLGEYLTQEEAARAYDREARAYFGEFARLNFPDIEQMQTEGVAP